MLLGCTWQGQDFFKAYRELAGELHRGCSLGGAPAVGRSQVLVSSWPIYLVTRAVIRCCRLGAPGVILRRVPVALQQRWRR